jgi:cytidylate kinase
LRAVEGNVDLDDHAALGKVARSTRIDLTPSASGLLISLEGIDVTGLIRTPEVDRAASKVSVVPEVREAMVEQQRRIGSDGGVVMDGRDIGTHVFPNADVKFFLLARPDVRATRRHEENVARGQESDLQETQRAIGERDERDESRAVAPLRPAEDAVVIDSSSLSPEGVLEKMLEIVESRS